MLIKKIKFFLLLNCFSFSFLIFSAQVEEENFFVAKLVDQIVSANAKNFFAMNDSAQLLFKSEIEKIIFQTKTFSSQDEFDLSLNIGEEFLSNSKAEEIEEIFGNMPSINFDPNNKHAAVLVHGLGASPYYMAMIAKVLFEKYQINTVNILLSGHGISEQYSAEQINSSKEKWQEDLNNGIQIARSMLQEGGKFFGIGFSAGATLIQECHFRAAESFGLSGNMGFDQLIFFSPGVKPLKHEALEKHCGPFLLDPNKEMPKIFLGKKNLKKYSFKYGKNSLAMACAFHAVTASRDQAQQELVYSDLWDQENDRLRSPVLTVYSKQDETICPNSIVEQINFLGWPDYVLAFEDVGHAKITMPQSLINIDFDAAINMENTNYLSNEEWVLLENSLENFLNDQLAS